MVHAQFIHLSAVKLTTEIFVQTNFFQLYKSNVVYSLKGSHVESLGRNGSM